MKKKIDQPQQKEIKLGPPLQYDPSFHPASYIKLSKRGLCRTEIAAKWGMSRETTYQWEKQFPELSDAIKKGQAFLEAWYVRKGRRNLERDPKSFNTGLYAWMTKNILKWTDRLESKTQLSGEVITNRKEDMKELFKTPKTAELALQLAEALCEEERIQNEQNSNEGESQGSSS